MIRDCLIVFLGISFSSIGQSFAPAPGFPGSTAIHKDSSIIIDWATSVQVTRGPLNIMDPGLGDVSYGADTDGIGMADNIVVSLGDRGEALIEFASPIWNGPGPDFAVFENGFQDHYIELAFVEVSSDGVNFHRFESISEAPTTTQLTNFSFSDCGYVHNLAGKYRALYGTPFDLEELNGVAGLNINAITHVKLIDVVGSINHMYGSFDSQGTIINDPFPTEFESGGFDLDAVGVMYNSTNSTVELSENSVTVSPNPTTDEVYVMVSTPCRLEVFNSFGKVVKEYYVHDETKISLGAFGTGVYFLKSDSFVKRIIVN